MRVIRQINAPLDGARDNEKAGVTWMEQLIPKLENLDSYYPMLCGSDHIVNVSQIKHLDGRHQPAVASQMGRG